VKNLYALVLGAMAGFGARSCLCTTKTNAREGVQLTTALAIESDSWVEGLLSIIVILQLLWVIKKHRYAGGKAEFLSGLSKSSFL
jgi:hypothetical protein